MTMRSEATRGGLALHLQFPDQEDILSSTATGAFFHEYCNSDAGFVRYDFDFVSPIHGHCEGDGLLASMVASLGLIFIARKSKQQALMRTAAQKYSRVLRMSARFLSDTDTAKSDELLATVWLLSLHEVRLARKLAATSKSRVADLQSVGRFGRVPQ